MARAYSLDFRKSVVTYIQNGGSKREASRVFRIGEDTIYRWQRLAKKGSLEAKKRTEYKRKVSDDVLIWPM